MSSAAWCEEERARHARIREAAIRVIPPKEGVARNRSPPGIPSTIRQAREAHGLTWYALSKRAGITNQANIRAIEQGKDVKLSDLQCVAPRWVSNWRSSSRSRDALQLVGGRGHRLAECRHEAAPNTEAERGVCVMACFS